MLQFNLIMLKVQRVIVVSCIGRSSENIRSLVAAEALRKKERRDETQFTTKIGGKASLGPSYFVL
jgi:hypothetical protein